MEDGLGWPYQGHPEVGSLGHFVVFSLSPREIFSPFDCGTKSVLGSFLVPAYPETAAAVYCSSHCFSPRDSWFETYGLQKRGLAVAPGDLTVADHDSLALAGSCFAWFGCFEAFVAYLSQSPYGPFVDAGVVALAWDSRQLAQAEVAAASQSFVAFDLEPPYVVP